MDSAPNAQQEQVERSERLNKVAPIGDISHTGFSLAAIKIQSGSQDELERILSSKIDRAHGAYRNAPVVLNVEDVDKLNDLDFFALQELCRRHDLFLLGVTGVVNEDRAEALIRRRIPVVNSKRYERIREENLKPKIITQFLEVKVPVQVPVPYEVKVPYEVNVPAPVKIVRRNVRSGETINGQNSSIAIYGSLGAHARIIASHHIFVFGNVNNADLFAGAPKDNNDPGLTDAIIHVQGNLEPGVLAIAGNYRTAEDFYNDPQLQQIKAQHSGIVVTLEDTNLRYFSAADFALG